MYLLFGSLIVAVEVFRTRRLLLDSYSFFSLFFLLSYCMAPIALLKRPITEIDYRLAADVRPLAFSVLFYFFYSMSYFSHYSKIRLPGTPAKTINASFLIAFMLLILYLYTSSYGGILRSLLMAGWIRAGEVSPGKFAFVKRLFHIAPFVVYYNMIIYLKNSCRRNLIQLLISIFIAVISLLLLAGRQNIILFFLSLSLLSPVLIKNVKRIYGRVVLLLVLFFPVVIWGKGFFSQLGKMGNDGNFMLASNSMRTEGIIDYFIENFAHPIRSVICYFDNSRFTYRIFVDYIIGVLSYIPQRFSGLEMYSVSYINTKYMLNVFESTIPPGAVAFSLYAFSYPGVAVLGALSGSIWRVVDLWLQDNIDKPFVMALYFPVTMYCGRIVFSSDPRVDIQGVFYLIVLFIFSFVQKPLIRKRARPLGLLDNEIDTDSRFADKGECTNKAY